MTKLELRKDIEELIDALLDEMGEGSYREDVTECAFVNILYGYYNNKYSLEDVVEASNYLEIPADIEEIKKQKILREKRKARKAAQ